MYLDEASARGDIPVSVQPYLSPVPDQPGLGFDEYGGTLGYYGAEVPPGEGLGFAFLLPLIEAGASVLPGLLRGGAPAVPDPGEQIWRNVRASDVRALAAMNVHVRPDGWWADNTDNHQLSHEEGDFRSSGLMAQLVGAHIGSESDRYWYDNTDNHRLSHEEALQRFTQLYGAGATLDSAVTMHVAFDAGAETPKPGQGGTAPTGIPFTEPLPFDPRSVPPLRPTIDPYGYQTPVRPSGLPAPVAAPGTQFAPAAAPATAPRPGGLSTTTLVVGGVVAALVVGAMVMSRRRSPR